MNKTVTSTFSVSAVKDGDKGENGKTTHFAYLYIGNSVAQEFSTFTLSGTTVLAWTYDKETVIAKRLSAGTYTASNDLFGGGPYPGLTKTAYLATFSTEMFAGAEYCGTYDDTNVEDSNDPSLYTWGRIKGDKGDKGDQGIRGLQGLQGEKGDQGIPGKDGVSTYFHIAYADNATGGGFSQNPTGKNYIGTYVDHTATDSTNPSAYKWQLVKGAQGEKGEKGIPGTNGNDGKTSYLHIAYANSADGKTGFDVSNSTGKLYIGQYVDFTEADSTDPTKYSWTKIKGDKGDKGDTGSTGPVMYNAGTWSSNTQYTNNGKATPMVMTESSSGGITSRNYWYLPNVGSSTNQDPRNGAPWEEVTGYAALFAEMAIINGGTLNDAVFKDGWMFSKAGRYMSNESYVYTTYNDTNWTNFDPTVYNSSNEALWRPLVAIDFRNGKAYYTDSINATGGEFNGNFSAYRNRIIIGKIKANSYADSDLYGIRFSDSHETECGSIDQFTDSNVSQCALTLTANDYSSSSPQEIGRLDIVPTTGIAHTASGSFPLLQNWSIGKYGDCLGLKSSTLVIRSSDSFDITSGDSGTFYVFDNDHDLTINLPEESLDGFTFEFKAINHPINLKVKNNSHRIVFQDEAQSNRTEQRIEDSVPRKYIYVRGRWFEMSYHH